MNVVLVHVSLRFVTLVRSHERRARPCFFAPSLVRIYECRAGPRLFALRAISPQL